MCHGSAEPKTWNRKNFNERSGCFSESKGQLNLSKKSKEFQETSVVNSLSFRIIYMGDIMWFSYWG